jgi:predicted O-methyltransferase YrrM
MSNLKTAIGNWVKNTNLYQQHKLSVLKKMQIQGLPEQVLPAVEWMVKKQPCPEIVQLMQQLEQRRAELAAETGEVEIWYSPRPGSAGFDPTQIYKPAPGEIKLFSKAQIAITGKDKYSAVMLHLLAKAQQATHLIELGACAGLSAAYMAAVSSIVKLWTVEGAPNLAAIAEQTLHPWQAKASVFTGHFDDAIDSLAPQHQGLWDFAYIDGHHEKIATIHYFNRLLPYLAPNAMVVFDDISWSQDMRDGWKELANRVEFSDAIDFGSIGVCILKTMPSAEKPRQWNLQPVLGKHRIGQPAGW